MKTVFKQSITFALVVLVAFLLAVPGANAKEESKVHSSLEKTGVDDDAAATIRSSFKKKKSSLQINCSGLEDGQSYRLLIDGVEKAEFTPKSGRANLKFNTNGKSKKKGRHLDFDPRDNLVSIADDSDSVLETVFNSEGDPEDSTIKEVTGLSPTALAPRGKGKAVYKRTRGRSAFNVEIENIPVGDYELYVDGIQRGMIAVTSGKGGKTKGEIEYDSQPSPPKLPLDFDPRNKPIDILRNAEAYFSDVMTAQIRKVNSCTFMDTAVFLPSTGVDADATAELEFETEEDCVREFKVEVEDLPVGDYDLIVDSRVRGVLSVTSSLSGTHGELEFSSDPDETGKLLLDFKPKGTIIEIQQGAIVYFSGAARNGVQVPSVCDGISNEVALINNGVIGSAKGKARFRQDDDCDQDFRVEIEDLPAGSYQLFVSGINRGGITVSLVNGDLEGEIEFDTDPDEPGEILLEFDPRNQLIEVRQGGTVFLSRTFPN